MSNINTESLEIMMEIVRLKKKLLKTVVPEKTMKHIDAISHEIKSMVLEVLSDQTSEDDDSSSKVKKVEIG